VQHLLLNLLQPLHLPPLPLLLHLKQLRLLPLLLQMLLQPQRLPQVVVLVLPSLVVLWVV
jgi:hypothetical protein